MPPKCPSPTCVPTYEHLGQRDSASVLLDFERRTQRSLDSLIPSPAAVIRRKHVRLNTATDEELWNDLQVVHGIGIRTLNKITTERALNGNFQGAADFDRRVKGVRFSKLEQACTEQHLVLSFETSASKRSLRPTRARPYVHPSLLRKVTSPVDHKEQQLKEEIVLSSWNAGRMSVYSDRYEEKVDHLFRFITDARTDIVSLQEVCEGVADDLCDRLREKSGVVWRSCEAYGDDDRSGTGLATIYRLDKFFEYRGVRQLESLLTALPFKRVPEVILFGTSERSDEYVALINVHLDQVDPREEIAAVAAIVRKLRQLLQNELINDTIIVLGDFNMNSDSVAFTPLREAALVELVRPPMGTGLQWHPYDTIQSATTIGNQWYDNIWISEGSRKRVKDAWCFDFGGRRQSLGQSGHKHAAQKRASCSDHLPVVARIQI